MTLEQSLEAFGDWLMKVQGRRGVAIVTVWSQRYRTRRALAELEPHALRDIGLDQSQADAEVRKPFWRA